MSHHYLEFKNVSFSYPESGEVLHDVSFRINHGENVALLGLNGSGKSTLLLLTNGLLMPTTGRIIVGDIPVTKNTFPIIRQTVGMEFQNSDDMLFMPTIEEDVAFGPRNMKLPEDEVSRRVTASLEAVGMSGFEKRPAFSLSGGQRRAAAIASVMAMEPSILVLDEPTSNLDILARKKLIDLLAGFRHSILLATHDLDMARELCPRSILLSSGRVVADGPTDEVIDVYIPTALKSRR
ncbi:MAG: energy-coupling factor ABC transporter ATP-binding protein [Muribaculaceae bacterium]|nr:energy-coupling factor ABC transporter ATP-binding protein [Muribaculaceae bacterium]